MFAPHFPRTGGRAGEHAQRLRLCGAGPQGRVLCFGKDEGEGKQVEKRKFMWPNRPVRTAAKPRCGFPSIHDKEC